MMKPKTVEGLISSISKYWTLADDLEITMEANPSSVEADRFRGYYMAGVNRISLGVQALNDVALKQLGRLHDAKSAIRAVEIAKKQFDRVNFDLIYARPGQTVSEWQAELKMAFELTADHLSLYQLTIEPDTVFHLLHKSGRLVVPDTEECANFYVVTQEICENHSMPAYEVSNHATKNSQCRHNLLYWRYGDYVGTGPGAHGRLTVGESRFATVAERDPNSWLNRVETYGHGLTDCSELTKIECGDEYLLLALRTIEGLDLTRFEILSGQKLDLEKIERLENIGLLNRQNGRMVKPTKKAFLVINSIISELSPTCQIQ